MAGGIRARGAAKGEGGPRRWLAKAPVHIVVKLLIASGLVAAMGGVVVIGTGAPAIYSSSPLGSDSYVAFPSTTAGNDGTVEALDSMNGQVVGSALTVGVNPGALAVDPATAQLVVANSGDSVHTDTTASIVSLTGTSAWSVTSTVTGLPTGSKPAAAMDTPKGLGLVVDNAAGDVSVVSMGASPSLVGNLSLGVSGAQPSSIATSPDGMYAYVTVPNKSDVIVLKYTGNPSGDDFTITTTYTTTSFTPVAITESADGDFAYVSNTSTNVIDKFDDSPTKWSLSSSTISMSAAPGAIVAAPNGNLYVSVPSTSQVAIINTTSGASPSVAYFTRSSTPGPLALNADSSIVEMASSSTSAVDLVNTTTGGTASTASSLPNTPSAITTYPTSQTRFFAYVANSGSGTVSVIDTITDSVVRTLTVGTDPVAIAVAPDNSSVFVANESSTSISVIDPADILTSTNPVVATISSGSLGLTASSGPDALAIDPSGTRLLVAEYAVGQVQVIDTNPNASSYLEALASPVDLNGSGSSSAQEPLAVAFAPSGQYAYVTDNGTGYVSVLQEDSATLGFSYDKRDNPGSVLTAPSGIAISPNGTTAYVTNSTSSGTLYAFPLSSTEDFGTASTEAVGNGPTAVALNPTATTAYVTNPGSGSVSVVPLAPLGSATPETASSASGAAVAPDGGLYLVANDASSGTVSVFGSGTSPLATVTVGSDPSAVAFGGDFSSPGAVVAPAATDVQGGASNPPEGWQGSGGQDLHRIASTTAFSDGVDTATGAYSLRIPDLNMPDIGPPLDLYQTYDSSAASTTGPLGYGWSLSYSMSVSGPTYSSGTGTCTITVSQEDGSTVSFWASSTGTCPTGGYQTAAADEQVTLSHTTSCNGTDPCWNLKRPDGSQVQFDATTGQLFQIVDRDGNTVSFMYSSGQLLTVTAASTHRSLSFTWSGGYVSSVTDSLGREVAFSYSSGELTKVTMTATNDPVTHYFQFTYNTSPPTLEDWWSPGNDPTGSSPSSSVETAITYNTAGQVDHVAQPQRSCANDAGTSNCNPRTTFTWQSWNGVPGTGTVLVSDPNQYAGNQDGNLTLDTYVDDTLVSQVRGYGSGEDTWATSHTVRNPSTLLPVEQMDGNGNVSSVLYDGAGDPLLSTDPLGRVTLDEYNGLAEVVAAVDPMANETTNIYNSTGDETSSVDPLGNTTSWAYGSGAPAGSAHTMTNALTGVTTYGYDSAGDLTSTQDPDGDVTSSLFDAVGELCASLSADGYAAGDRIPSSCPSAAASYLTAYPAYDFFGHDLKKITPTDAAGGTWLYGYDADGNETSVENPDSQTTSYTFDANDEQASQVLPAVSGTSPTTTYAYDPGGNKVTTTRPLGNVSGCGCASQHTWTTAYDNLGQQTSSTDPQSNTTSFTYDKNGNQLVVTPPAVTHSEKTTNTYDADNELLRTTDNLGDESTYGYNAKGQQDCAADQNATADSITCPANPTGRVSGTTTTTYTADGKVATTEDPLGNITTDYYDADNNKVAYTNPEGNPGTCNPLTTSHCAYTYYFVFDTADRTTSATTPPTATSSTGQTTSYTNDADGNQKTVTDPLGQVTTNGYDGLGELTGVTYTSTVNATPNVTYSYTNEGKLYQMVDGTGTTTYTYDADQRTTQVQNGAGAVLTYTYDVDGNTTCIGYPGTGYTCSSSPSSSNHVVDYTFDHDDRMSTVTDWAGGTLTYTYNHDSVPQELSANSSAVTENLSYDAAGNTTDVSTTAGSATLLDLAYSYDADGNPARETPTIGTTTQTVENFANDAANRVAYFWTGAHSLKPANPNVTYGNDGELNQNGPDTTSQAMGYDQAGELCWVYTSTVSSPSCSSPPSGSGIMTFDADGERTKFVPGSGNSEAYAWNAASELRCANTNGTTCSISSPTSTTTLYLYDGNGLRASSTISSTATGYTWDTTSAVPRVVSAGSTSYLYGNSSAPVVQITGSASDLLVADPVGSVHGLVQLSSGALQNILVNYTDYDSYGVPNNAGALTQAHSAINVNWVATSGIGFGGAYEDATGLAYQQRFYVDTETGQLLSGAYRYATDNPIREPTPSGQPWVPASTTTPSGSQGAGIASAIYPRPPGGQTCPANMSGYTGSAAKYNCVDGMVDWKNHIVWIRNGCSQSACGASAFGYLHFYRDHAMELETAQNIVAWDELGGTEIDKAQNKWSYNWEYLAPGTDVAEQYAIVIESRNAAPVSDKQETGVITGYCQGPTHLYEQDCPEWVNSYFGG